MHSTRVERIRKLRNLTVEHGATEHEADTAARIADELEAALTDEEKESAFVAEAKEDFSRWEPDFNYSGKWYQRESVWYADNTGGIYTKNNPVPSTGFAERLRRRSPFG